MRKMQKCKESKIKNHIPTLKGHRRQMAGSFAINFILCNKHILQFMSIENELNPWIFYRENEKKIFFYKKKFLSPSLGLKLQKKIFFCFTYI